MHVEKRISALLPGKFALVFDGWSAGIDHYVAVFATYPSNNAKGFQSILLAFSPFEDDESQSADSHITLWSLFWAYLEKT